MDSDIFSIIGLWWMERINAGLTPGENVKLQTQSDPGWLLAYGSPALTQFTLPSDRGFRRSNHDFLSIMFEDNQLRLACGLFNLGELMWRFIEMVDARYLTRLAPEVPFFFHNQFSPKAPLDLCARLIKWFASRCDYDWEDDGGFDLETTEKGWILRVDTNDDYDCMHRKTSLTETDLKVLNRPPLVNEITYKQAGGVASAEFPAQLFTEAIARVLEWIEEDWKEIQEFAPSDKRVGREPS